MPFWKPIPQPPTDRSEKIVPEVGANPWSKLTFGWMNPMLLTGYSRPLEVEDIWKLDAKRLTAHLSESLEAEFFSRCPPSKRPAHLGGPSKPTQNDYISRPGSSISSATKANSLDAVKDLEKGSGHISDGEKHFDAETLDMTSRTKDEIDSQRQNVQEEIAIEEVAQALEPNMMAPDLPAIERTVSLAEKASRQAHQDSKMNRDDPSKPIKSSNIFHKIRQAKKLEKEKLVTEVGPDGVRRTYDQSLTLAILWTLRKQIFLALSFKICASVISTTSSLVTKRLIKYITARHYTPELSPSIGHGIGLAVGLAVMQECTSLLNNHYFAQSMSAGWQSRAMMIDQISRKSLRLSPKARLTMSNGRLVTSVSGDCSFLDFASPMFIEVIVEPFTIVIGFILLIVNLGYSALVGVAVLLASTPLLGLLFRILIGSRQQQMKIVDSRVRLLTETLNNIRQVKLNAYEHFFMTKLLQFRGKELDRLKINVRNRATMVATMTFLPTAAAVLTFVTYGLTGHTLDAATIFASLQLFAIVQQPLRILPMAFTALSDTHVALKRMSQILLADELPRETLIVNEQAETAISVTGDFTFETSQPPDTSSQAGFRWRDRKAEAKEKKEQKALRKENKERALKGLPPLENKKEEDLGQPFTLTNIDLQIPRGSFVVVCGRIGNGKSALLSALIGEMRQTRGSPPVFDGRVAYVSQQPWVQNATVRDNIVFGQELSQDKLAKTIEACALTRDIDQFAAGLDTEIGERGINLSGGQKARLCLGRAVYFDADTILMDDPLAAVDSHVAQHLISECLVNPDVLGKKTRILVTHQMSVIPYADIVLVVENGKIVQNGSPQKLLEDENGIFALLMQEYGTNKEDDGADEPKEETQSKLKTKSKEKKGEADEADGKNAMAGKLVMSEERNTGSVSWSVYLMYARYMGVRCLLALAFLLAAQASNVGNTLFLGFWSGGSINGFHQGDYMGVYAGLGAGYAFFTFCGSLTLSLAGLRASYRFFEAALLGVFRSPISFHDTTPIGRIISRLSKDIEMIDDRLTFQWYQLLAQGFQVIGTVFLVFYSYTYLGIIFVPMLLLYGLCASFYRRTSREVKRLDSNLRSFIYSAFQEQLTGLPSIRAYQQQKHFRTKLQEAVDAECRTYFTTIILQRWLGIRLDFMGSILILAIGLFGVGFAHSVSPSKLGVVLTYSMSRGENPCTGYVISELIDSCRWRRQMNNVERVSYYGALPHEAAPRESRDPPKDWPQHGHIVMDSIKMKYRDNLPLVIKGLSLEIQPGWKVGIVGRTGAGKSSLGQILFRMVELAEGKILIDGVDLRHIGLDTLREQLSIIPQDSLLYAGTIKENLDPTGAHTDAQLQEALRRCGLVPEDNERNKERYEKFKLDARVSDEGSNFSGGERQLVALARALVKNRKVLLLDEATSSVDPETDAQIQRTIRAEFGDVTLLSIAHRLATVAFYDRILVMDDGQVAEYDTPLNLFDKEDSIFRSMCDAAHLTRPMIERIRAGDFSAAMSGAATPVTPGSATPPTADD